MLQVKIIEADSYFELQDSINEWLKDRGSLYEIVDIKYSGSGCYAPYGVKYYSAMILYKKLYQKH